MGVVLNLAGAAAAPVYDAEPCWTRHMVDVVGGPGDETAELTAGGLFGGLLFVVGGATLPATETRASMSVAFGALLWWLSSAELNRELCDGGSPGPGIWLGWASVAAAAWSIPAQKKFTSFSARRRE